MSGIIKIVILLAFVLLATLSLLLIRKRVRLEHMGSVYLIIVWSVGVLALTIIMRRFDYYLSVPLSLLCGAGVYGFYMFMKSDRKGKLISVVVILCVLVSMTTIATVSAVQKGYMGDDWEGALLYLRDRTPNPAHYTVLTWWDYGYWVMHVSKRPQTCNPAQTTGTVRASADIFMDTGDPSGKLDALGVRYIVIDRTAVIHKLWAMARWVDEDYKDYIEAHYIGKRQNVYKQAYFDTWIVRLFNPFPDEQPVVQPLGFELVYSQGEVKVWERSY